MVRPEQRIAVLGTGRMGSCIVRRLTAVGSDVAVWNRTLSKAEPLVRYGARLKETAASAVRDAEFAFLALPDGTACADLLFNQGVADAMSAGRLVVSMSATRPDEARDHARRLSRRDIGYVDAPVTGGTVGAESGTLLIAAGGSDEDIERVTPLLSVLGRVMPMGESGAGQFAKLANQLIKSATAQALSEMLYLAEREGIDPERVLDCVRGGLVHSRAVELYGRRMLSGDFRPRGARLSTQKELAALKMAGIANGVELPMVDQLTVVFDRLVSEHGDLDKSAVILALDSSAPPQVKSTARQRTRTGRR